MRKRIVVLGGGTGTFTVLSGLKKHDVDLSAIVSIADNGGSTGILRDELGVLPPGDIRQCLVALSEGDSTLRDLFTYRFHEGSLSGHTFGNLFLSALEKLTGNPLSAVSAAHRILRVRGNVIPVSAQSTNLFAELEDGSVVEGEHAIDAPTESRAQIRRCFLSPAVEANAEALSAIRCADLVVLGPGDLFTSIIPVLLVDGVAQALTEGRARIVYIANLVTKRGQTVGYTAKKFCDTIQSILSPALLTDVVLNTGVPDQEIVQRYHDAGEECVRDDLNDEPYRIWRADLVSRAVATTANGDRLARSLLRHDSALLAKKLLELLQS